METLSPALTLWRTAGLPLTVISVSLSTWAPTVSSRPFQSLAFTTIVFGMALVSVAMIVPVTHRLMGLLSWAKETPVRNKKTTSQNALYFHTLFNRRRLLLGVGCIPCKVWMQTDQTGSLLLLVYPVAYQADGAGKNEKSVEALHRKT